MEGNKEVTCQFFSAGKCRFGEECWNIHDVNCVKVDDRKIKTKKSVKKTDETNSKKKSPMKTAVDVISRLQWDESFSSHLNDFVVGYLDRFIGTVERKFQDFNWVDDIVDVSYFSETLAIPRHRILFFKYKNTIIWDRAQRQDHLFGSTGNEKLTMDEIIILDKSNSNNEENIICSNSSSSKAQDTLQDSSDEEDDGIEVVISQKPIFQAVPSRPKFPVTTHCVVVNINNGLLSNSLSLALDFVSSNVPNLKPYLYTPGMLHVSLITLHLNSNEEIKKCIEISKTIIKDLKSMNESLLKFHVKGFGHFRSKVLYAKVDCDDSFLAYVKDIHRMFTDAGFMISSNIDSILHITLAKIKGRDCKNMKIDDIIENNLKMYKDYDFGTQDIDNLYMTVAGSAKYNNNECYTSLFHEKFY